VSKSNSYENSLLLLIFNATTFADLAENDTTSPATSLYVSLHTSDPGEAGAQNTSETVYTNYARQGVVRTSSGWTVSGTAPTQAANAAVINFPQCGATGATITHFGIGTLSTGAGVLLYSGALDAQLVVSSGITPSFAAGTCKATED
jgi:hypothetical protein